MSEIWIISLTILLVDILNPVLFAVVIMMLTGSQPLLKSAALIVGHTVAYFVVGVLIVFGLIELIEPYLERFLGWLTNPTPSSFIGGFVIGIVLISIALAMLGGKVEPKTVEKPPSAGMFQVFLLGATINFIGAPFAVPYFGFINELFRFEVDAKLTALVLYNIGYALPFALLPMGYALFGDRILRPLRQSNEIIERIASKILPLLFGLLGVGFVIDAVMYFVTGHGLI